MFVHTLLMLAVLRFAHAFRVAEAQVPSGPISSDYISGSLSMAMSRKGRQGMKRLSVRGSYAWKEKANGLL